MRLTPVNIMRALFALARLGVTTRFRFAGAYWAWRHETAFGSASLGAPLSRREKIDSVLEYGLWVAQMRRLMK